MNQRLEPAIVCDLPLLELFYRLREAELPLGIEEYELLPRAMLAGFGFAGVDSLKRLCRMLWIKTRDEEVIFNHVFAEFLREKPVGLPAGVDSPATTPGEQPTSTAGEERPSVEEKEERRSTGPVAGSEARTADVGAGDASRERSDRARIIREPRREQPRPVHGAKLSAETTTSIDDEAIQFLMPRLGQAPGEAQERRYRFSVDYLPITKRQMKQSWRYLRKAVREGPPVELDVEATVNKVANEGRLYHPVLRPRRINRAAMVLMVDQEGSMTPFHSFSRRLEETAMRGGRLGQTNIFYFRNYPLGRLYCNAHFSESLTLAEVMSGLHPTRTAVLIFSDAGAARNRYSYERVDMTRAFLRQLNQSVRYVAWLNPMPIERWANTSAAAIARSVPMFDISRQGLHNAISVLRGRTIPRR